MADLSVDARFSAPARAARPLPTKWSARRSLALIVGASLVLWGLILSPLLLLL